MQARRGVQQHLPPSLHHHPPRGHGHREACRTTLRGHRTCCPWNASMSCREVLSRACSCDACSRWPRSVGKADLGSHVRLSNPSHVVRYSKRPPLCRTSRISSTIQKPLASAAAPAATCRSLRRASRFRCALAGSFEIRLRLPPLLRLGVLRPHREVQLLLEFLDARHLILVLRIDSLLYQAAASAFPERLPARLPFGATQPRS
mgnify:CR=1 FL=1